MCMRRASRGRRYFPLSFKEVEGTEGMLESAWLGAVFCDEEVGLAVEDGSSGGVKG
jgi:hypothetical protein